MVQLAGVGFGDGGHCVRHQYCTLHQIDVVPPLVFIAQAALIPPARQGKGALQLRSGELALIGDIVDRIDRFDAPQVLPPGLIVLKIQHRRSGLPVVAVQDVGPEVEQRQQVDHSPAEQSEAPRVVLVAVEPRPVKKVVIFHEPDGHAGTVAAIKTAGRLPVAEAHRRGGHKGKLLGKAVSHALIQRRDDRDLIPRRLERRRQGKGNVCQSAGFTERSAFAGNK